MADIKQAAKWMQEGKKVKRQNPHSGEPLPSGYRDGDAFKLDKEGFIICTCHKRRVPFFTTALLADDWEIAP